MARKLIFLVLALSLCCMYGMAQSKDFYRIARLSYVEGKVSFQHTDEVDWTAASINLALQPGDRIYSGDNGRAEIEFDDGSVLRLAEKTDVEILSMREDLIQLKVLIGLCSLTGRSSVEFELNTPAAAFTTTEKGSYRFDVAENGDSDGIVRKGAMDVVNNHFSRHVSAGEVLHVPASENSTEVVAHYDQRDAWDEWVDRRNADQTAVESRRYVADSVHYGVSDLDRYGRWDMVDAYGPAWIPTVGVGWSPYWEGRWCYRPSWGWTWVSYEPWGWLPYHYGRWYNSMSSGWCWIPGPSFGFNFWSPGLVRFYHGVDSISWIPLGPGDYYNVNNYYFNMHSRANVYYLNEMRLMQRRSPDDLVNRRAPGAFRSVTTDHFVNSSLGSGSRVEQVRGIQDPRQAARIVTDNLDVRPTARSFAPAPDRGVNRPDAKPKSVVVRTEPDFRSRSDRYTPITNPMISVPRSRTEPAARNLQSTPSAVGRGTQDVPARVYQVPQSRTTSQPPAARPSYGQQGRDTPVMQGQRQDTTQRSQQAPAARQSSRMDTAPPVSRSSSSNSNGSFSSSSSSGGGYSGGSNSGGSYSGGSSSVSSSGDSGRVMSSSSSPSSSVSRSSGPDVSRSSAGSAPPASSAPPAASSGSAVKKMPERPVAQNYAPRSYQAPRDSQPSRAVSSQAQAYGTPSARSTSNQPASAGSSLSYSSSASRSSYSGGSSASTRSAPQSSAPRMAAPQSRPSGSSGMSAGVQRSASSGGSSSAGSRSAGHRKH